MVKQKRKVLFIVTEKKVRAGTFSAILIPCGQAYNVGLSNANLSKLELCEKIKEHVPSLAVETSEFSSDPDKRNYIVSNEKIESTGWAPDYTIDDGIKELLKAYKIFTNVPTTHH